MKIRKGIILCLTAIVMMLFSVACSMAGTISGVEIYRFKVGEATDEKLLENVSVLTSNGEELKPTLKKGEADYDKAGEYNIAFVYGVNEIKTKLYVYGMPTLYYNDAPFTSDVLNLTYREAKESYDFNKNISIRDSFGEALSVTVLENSAKYDGGTGDYTVTYAATDCVGNSLEKTITYQVSMEKAPVVAASELVLGRDLPVLTVDWQGATEAYLYKGDELVADAFYKIKQGALEFSERYIIDLGVGTHSFSVYTVEGVTNFDLVVADLGYPVYEMNSLKAEYALGTTIAEEPDLLYASEADCSFSYTLTDSNGKVCGVQDEFGELTFVDSTGELLSVGQYTLTVTAKVGGDKQTTRSYSFEVTSPKLVSTGTAKFELVTLDESEYGVSQAYRFVKGETSAWDGRLEARVSGGTYQTFSFDIFVNDASTRAGDYIGTKSETEGKRDNTPQFSVAISAGGTTFYDNISRIYDKKTGVTVKEYEMKVGQWYTVEVSLARQTEDGVFYFYVGPYDNAQVSIDAYITNIKFTPYSVNLTNVIWTNYNPASGKLTLTQGVDESGNATITYKSTASHWDARAQFSSKMLEKYQLYYTRSTADKAYELTFEMKYVSAPTDMQFWLMDENGYLANSAPTLASMQANGIARVYDESWLLVNTFESGKWYKVYIDVTKLGWLGCRSGTEMGMQMGFTQGEVQFRKIAFEVKSNEIKNMTAEAFTKVAGATATLTSSVGADGVTITTYTGTGSEWAARIQFSDAFYAKYQEYYALCSTTPYFLTMEICFTSAPADIQFWQIKKDGNFGATPKLNAYIADGRVKVSGKNTVTKESDMIQGEWYTLTFDLAKIGELGKGSDKYGLQWGSLATLAYKNVAFVK